MPSLATMRSASRNRLRSSTSRANRVVLAQILQRLIREHHAPPERLPGRVALHHGDLMIWIAQLHRDAGIKSRRPPADAYYLHVLPFAVVRPLLTLLPDLL